MGKEWEQVNCDVGEYRNPKTGEHIKCTQLAQYKCPDCNSITDLIPFASSYTEKCEICKDLSPKEKRKLKNHNNKGSIEAHRKTLLQQKEAREARTAKPKKGQRLAPA
ncbi:hypothetical protein C0584_01375 [Candidatus Parcubacteria bacterium]|mgnify:CR=1 FL=1|nr:MAG: hypothetical protein C0584_01375 [Candidatus Parcubacteria bacterium]